MQNRLNLITSRYLLRTPTGRKEHMECPSCGNKMGKGLHATSKVCPACARQVFPIWSKPHI